jgi:hypothetical protein
VVDGDRFIHEQLAPHLAAGEIILQTAYLETARGGGVLGNMRARGYWAALTAGRLFLIETRVGAFRALLENRAVQVVDRSQIQGAHVTTNAITLALADGRKIALMGNRRPKYTPRQAAFFDEIAMRHGGTAVALELGRTHKRTAAVGAIAALVVCGLMIGYRMYWGRAEVSVSCASTLEGIQCTATHVGGGASTKTCWDVVLACANGARSRAKACATVEKNKPGQATLAETAFEWKTPCDQLKALTVENMTFD